MGKLASVLCAALASGLACGSRSQLLVPTDATVEPAACDGCASDVGEDIRDAPEAAEDEAPDVFDAPDEPACCNAGNGCSEQGCGCEASVDCCAGASCVGGVCSMPFCEPSPSQGPPCLGPGQYCACLIPGERRGPFDQECNVAAGRHACVPTPPECLPDGCAGPSTCACLLARMYPDANPCPQGFPMGCFVSGWNVILDCQEGERLVDGGR